MSLSVVGPGKCNLNLLPKYVVLSIPLLMLSPVGCERSRIIRLLVESRFGRDIRGLVTTQLKGACLNGPSKAPLRNSVSM